MSRQRTNKSATSPKTSAPLAMAPDDRISHNFKRRIEDVQAGRKPQPSTLKDLESFLACIAHRVCIWRGIGGVGMASERA
jgi:hypothetical protein